MRKRVLAVSLSALIAVMSVVSAPAASAVVEGDSRDHLVQFLQDNGVEAATQATLLAKMDNGELWDSLNGSSPVSTDTVTYDGWEKVVETYADGSITVTRLQVPQDPPDGAIQPMGISGCTNGTNGLTRTRTNCYVEHNSGVINMWFTATYSWTYWVATDAYVQSASIKSARNPGARTFGGSFSSLSLAIQRKTAAPGRPAIARVSTVVTLPGGWGSTSAWMQLNVPCGGYELAYTTRGA